MWPYYSLENKVYFYLKKKKKKKAYGKFHHKFCSPYVTQRELMRLFEGEFKTDILNSLYCLISKEHFDTKTSFLSYSYQKLKII